MTSSSLRSFAAQLRGFAHRHRVPLIVTLAILLLGTFAFQNLSEVSRVARAIGQANPILVLAALMTQLVLIGLAGLSYRIVLRLLDHRQPWIWLTNLHLKRHVVGTVTPIGGPASIYVFIKSLGERGVSHDDALFAAAIRSLTGYTSFVALLVPVLLISHPSSVILVGAVLLVAFLAVLVALMLLLLRESFNPRWLTARLPERLAVAVQQARSHRLSVRDLTAPFALAVAHNLLGVTTLYLCLLAIGQRPDLLTPLAGYAIGSLFMMVAPVFQGIGVVELTMAVALQQLGIPAPAAVAATILYRLSDLWFPFVLGTCTHGLTCEPARRVYPHLPAVATATAGLALLALPLIAPSLSLSVANSAAVEIVPLLSIVAGAWCVALAISLWRRRPLASLAAAGPLVVMLPLLVSQGGDQLNFALSFIQVAMWFVIG